MQAHRTAAIALYPLGVLYLVHTMVALVNSSEAERPYLTVIGNVINTGVVCGLLAYVAQGMWHAKRLKGALGVLGYLVFQAVVLAGIVLSKGVSVDAPMLYWVQGAYVVNLFVATGLTLVANLKAQR